MIRGPTGSVVVCGLVLLSAAVAAAAEPIRPKIARCRPEAAWDDRAPELGRGNLPEHRQTWIDFGYFTRDAADDGLKQDVLAATNRIEVCYARDFDSLCPGEPGWVIFDRAVDPDGWLPELLFDGRPSSGGPDAWILNHDSAGASFQFRLPVAGEGSAEWIDWGDRIDLASPAGKDDGKVFFLRVNNEPDVDAIGQGGWCPVSQLVGQQGAYRLYGAPGDLLDPWGGFFAAQGGADTPEICRDGNRAQAHEDLQYAPAIFTGSPIRKGQACVGRGAAAIALDLLERVGSWQWNRAMHALDDLQKPNPPSYNGSSTALPFRFVSFPDQYGRAIGHGGRISIPPSTINGVARSGPIHASLCATDANCPPVASSCDTTIHLCRNDYLSVQAAALARILGHEQFHTLQERWLDDRDARLAVALAFSEQAPPSIETALCIFDYPGLLSTQCASPRKLGFMGDGVDGFQLFLHEPNRNPLATGYPGVIFWRYAMEQFAIPSSPGNPAHPDGPDSTIPANPLVALGARSSDEGSDLLGLAMYYFSQHALPSEEVLLPGDQPAEDAIDAVLRDKLGRSFSGVVLDMHTAALLKDYKDGDPRWRFEWVGDYNAGSPAALLPGAPVPGYTFLNDRKPFTVPPELYGVPPDADDLPRARRELDSYVSGPGGATKVWLQPGRSAVSPSQVELQDLGASYLAVAPEPGYGDLIFRVQPYRGAMPRVRLFVVPDAPPGIPYLAGGCGVDPDGAEPGDTERCATLDGAVDVMINVPPAGSPGEISELLAVVSADRHPARFDYGFGPIAATLTIVSPTLGHPTQIGDATAPRPFVLQASVMDRAFQPLRSLAGFLRVEVPGCPAASCDIPGVAFTEVATGRYWAVVSVPTSHYPPPGIPLDLRVSVDGNGVFAWDLEPQALLTSTTAAPLLTTLVLDRSGSMSALGSGKLLGLKTAAQLVVDGLNDSDELGIVTFNNDAQTRLELLPLDPAHRAAAADAIETLAAGGDTSIGDGVFEAQSLLATRQNQPDPANPREHVMVVLSDGLNNREWPPEAYYLRNSGAFAIDGTDLDDTDPTPADNVEWSRPPLGTGEASPLNFVARAEHRDPTTQLPDLTVPRVHAVALGQDADLIALHNLAGITGGVFSYAANHPGVESTDVALELSDAFRAGLNASAGLERVMAARVPSTSPSEMPALRVEPGASELLVSVAAPEPGADPAALALLAPGGAVLVPVASTATTAVFRVAAPEPGTWTFLGPAPPSSTGYPTVFVEQSVRHDLFLFAQADSVQASTPISDPADNGRTVGSWVTIRAALADPAPVTFAEVVAEVTPAGLPPFTVPLSDDGRGYDGGRGDGIYAATVRATGAAGAYRVRVVATGTSPTSKASFRREAHLAFELHLGADQDGDGLPDVWEVRHGTDPAVADEDEDPDGDGLSNEEELQTGTEPWQSDTDFGGESDLSELASGRDPFRREDDEFPRFTPTLCPGNGKVTVVPNLPFPAELISFELQEVTPSGGRGPVTRVVGDIIADPGFEAQEPFQPPPPIEVVAQNNEEFCVEMRLGSFFGAESGFSPTRCVTPREDPYAPEVRVELPDLAGWSSRTRDVRLSLRAIDELRDLQEACRPRDPAAVSTGVTDVRVSTRADFEGTGWEPFTATRSVWLPDQPTTSIWVQVRDGAGNVSRPVYVLVGLVAKTPLDDAIGYDERALDLLVAGDFAPAVREVAAGMASFLGSLETVRRRAMPARLADPIDTTLLAELKSAHALKRAALSAGGPRKIADAEVALRAALVHERYAAQLAADTGKEL